jgi:hypothetical protein
LIGNTLQGRTANHPCSNGQIERMKRTIIDATMQRFLYDSNGKLRTHLADYIATYNFAC